MKKKLYFLGFFLIVSFVLSIKGETTEEMQAQGKQKFSITMPEERTQQGLLSGNQLRNLFIAAGEGEEAGGAFPDRDIMRMTFFTGLRDRSYPLVISRALWADFCEKRKTFAQ